MIRTSLILIIFAVALNGVGCSKKRPTLIPVRGQITYNGGQWPGRGQIFFRSITPATGFPSRPGNAHFDIDGKFEAMSYTAGDGLYPGEYNVLFLYEPARVSGDAIDANKVIKAEDKLTVPADSGPIEYKFDVKKK